MRIPTAVSVLFLSLGAVHSFVTHSFAQSPAVTFGETVEVRVVNVDVVVSDRQGRPVRGLAKEDFELFTDGDPQTITNFYEVASGPAIRTSPDGTAASSGDATKDDGVQQAGADLRPRKLIFFIDDATLSPHSRNRVLAGMKRFLTRTFRPGDEAMVAEWRTSLTISLPFTSSREAIEKALDTLAGKSAGGTGYLRDRDQAFQRLSDLVVNYSIRSQAFGSDAEKPPFSSGIAEARGHAERVMFQMQKVVAALNAITTSVAGIEGRKALIYATEALPARPGREAFAFLDGIRDKFEGGSHANTMAEAASFNGSPLIESIIATANASGVTLYPVHGGGSSGNFISAEQGGSADLDFQTARSTASREAEVNDQEPLRSVASATGGLALVQSSNFDLAFDNISNDLTNFYSLGFRPSGTSDRVRSVNVRVKKKGYSVRTRRALIERSARSEIEDAVRANLFHDVKATGIGVGVRRGEGTAAADQQVRVPFEIIIPMESLTLLPEGEELAGRFSIYAAFVKKDGAVSSVTRNEQQFRIPAASLKRRKELTVKLDVTMDRETSLVSLGVVDEISRAAGFNRQKLD